MANKKKVLLAFGGEALTASTSKTLQEAGFQVMGAEAKKSLRLPKERFDYLVQLGCDPRPLTEGTHQLLEKAQKEGSKFLLISSLRVLSKPPTTCDKTCLEALHLAEALTQEFHQRHGVNATILRLPILYGPGIPLQEAGALGEMLSEFAANQTTNPTLTIYGEGEDTNYYLFLTDAAEAIKLALTAKGETGIIYDALPSTPISSIKIAEILNEMGGNRHEIHQHRGLTPIEDMGKPTGKALPHLEPKISLKEGILETLKAVAEEKSPPKRKVRRPKITYPIPQQPMMTKRRIITTAIFLLLIVPTVYVGGRVGLASSNLIRLNYQIRSFDFQAAERSAENASANFAAINRFLSAIPFTKATSRGPLRSLILLSQAATEATAAVAKVANEGEIITTLIENLLKSRQGESTTKQTGDEFNRLATALKEAEDQLLTSQLHLTQVGPPFNRWTSPYLDPLQQGIKTLGLGKEIASAAFELLGYRGERNYLILLQNTAESRAGGGFLGSLAQITLKDGGIKTLEFFDSYHFDTVGAAAPITAQNLIGVKTFRLRESNFYASFPESGRQISQLYEEAQGVKINGIIGLNLLFAQELIALSGPLELSGFERTVTAENLFEVTTEEVEKEFFPGSTKKKRFLQALGEELLNNLFTLERKNYAALAGAAWNGLEGKDILLFFKEGGLTQALVEGGFDGRVRATDKDFLMAIDSNYGTKANVWIKRNVAYKVFNINRANQLQGELTITWEHAGTSAWPSGTYTNLFRVLIPKGSRLTEATLNGEDCLSNIMETEEAGKTEFATLLRIEPQTTAILKLSYTLPSALDLRDDGNYSLWVQKQPGVIGDSFSFTFEKPFGKEITSGGLQREGTGLTLRGDLQRDLNIKVEVRED